MAAEIALQAELFISLNTENFVVVANGNQVAVSFNNLESLEHLLNSQGGGGGSKPPAGAGKSGGAPGGLKMLEDLNAAVREMHLEVKIVVAGKTYLELGGRNYRITMAAVFGKLGSFFKKL